MKLLRFASRKIIAAILTIFLILCVNFVIFRIAPGDPVRMMFKDPRVPAQQIELQRKKFGLDKPLSEQFVAYLEQLAQGDLGISFWQQRPVSEIIAERIPNTLLLVLPALFVSTILGIIMGALSGWVSGTKLDTFILSSSLTMYSIPAFAMGIILLLFFAFYYPLFPLGGIVTPASGYTGFDYFKDVFWHMCLPGFSIVLWYVGEYVILTRSSMLDVLNEEYIVTARSKGVKESRILWKHAVRNALLPVITLTGINVGFAVAGVIEAETVFSWPGVGKLIYDAVTKRDYPLLQGAFLVFAVSVVLANLIIDLIYSFVDPRIRTGGQ